VVAGPVIAEASLRIAITAPVPASTIAANTPAVTRIGRIHAAAAGVRLSAPSSGRKSIDGRAALTPAAVSE
jgi:hypothetical protein